MTTQNILRAPNGALIIGSLEVVHGIAAIASVTTANEGHHRFAVEYDGETKINWDSQESLIRNGKRQFIDENDDVWSEDQLKLEPSPDVSTPQPSRSIST